jgi:TPP-dependent pyruvate/acetoin dehydrogenase alpha subunit
MSGRPRVTCCFFGEGAAAEGEFHESMNLAALWKLPVLFVCENNLYAMGTALERSESETDICQHARSYRIAATSVDGMDVVAVEVAARRAVQAVRDGNGPQFLETRTYRFRAHSMFDPDLYRDKAEVENGRSVAQSNVFASGFWLPALHESEIAAIEIAIADEVENAVKFAEALWEPEADLTRDVLTPIKRAHRHERAQRSPIATPCGKQFKTRCTRDPAFFSWARMSVAMAELMAVPRDCWPNSARKEFGTHL